MKKIIVSLLSVILVFCCFGCVSGERRVGKDTAEVYSVYYNFLDGDGDSVGIYCPYFADGGRSRTLKLPVGEPLELYILGAWIYVPEKVRKNTKFDISYDLNRTDAFAAESFRKQGASKYVDVFGDVGEYGGRALGLEYDDSVMEAEAGTGLYVPHSARMNCIKLRGSRANVKTTLSIHTDGADRGLSPELMFV